jgi:hypothetical protein
MRTVIAAAFSLFATTVTSKVVFSLSTEPNGQGYYKSWVVDRWVCLNLKSAIDKQASWAFVTSGLANGCQLYE